MPEVVASGFCGPRFKLYIENVRTIRLSSTQVSSKFFTSLYLIFCADNYNVSDEEIIRKAKQTFQIELSTQVSFVKLKYCFLLSPKLYPVCTLLGQNLGSMIVGLEALFKCPPDILIDTMGVSFIFPLFQFLGQSKVCAYVHYPIISTDMLDVVARNVSSFNNRQVIARSTVLSHIKLWYYKIFAFIYKLTGKCADVIMVNSTWTNNHISQVWNTQVNTVYPPCNTEKMEKLGLDNKDSSMIISISQFRPEKNHQLQLESVKLLLDLLKENQRNIAPKLYLIGSCRNSDDEARVNDLKKLCKEMQIEEFVEFKVNIEYDEMEKLIEKASIAIHTMLNEHFGISVVEFLAAGLLTLTHNSGGPKIDIIDESRTGFLATNAEEFAQTLFKILSLPESESQAIRLKARSSVGRFSQQSFENSFNETIGTIL